jgi:hypothetical protein
MTERNKIPRQRAKPKSSILSVLQSLFAIIGVILTIFICMIVALLAISPSSIQDIVVQVYPVDTQEPQFVVVTATQPLPTSTLTPPPATNIPEQPLPSGEWSVRCYDTDDVNILVVNGHIVGASTYGGPSEDTGWININPYFQGSKPNYVTFVNVNGPREGIWAFELQHDGTTVWRNDGTTNQANKIGYFQTVEILPDNSIREVSLIDPESDHLEGQWAARVIVKDVGLILINGIPVAAGYEGMNLGWFNASEVLLSGAENEVTAIAWNIDGEYVWDLAILKGEDIVWGSFNRGTEQVGEVFQTTFIIDANGEVIP